MESETTPLLASSVPKPLSPSSDPTHTTASQATRPSFSSLTARLLKHLKRWRALYLCGLLIFVVDFPIFMTQAPLIRLLELGVCRDYYKGVDPGVIGPGGDIPEEQCKLVPIQTELAKMKGLLGVVELVPGLILSIPYGILADKRGRRFVAALGLVGAMFAESYILLVLSLYKVFPLKAIFAFPVFILIGGGSAVVGAVFLAIIADLTPGDVRTRVFFLLSVMVLVSELVSPPIGASLMKQYGPRTTLFLAIPTRLLVLLILAFIPSVQKTSESSISEHSDGSLPETDGSTKTGLVIRKIEGLLAHIQTNVFPLLNNQTIVLGLLALLVNNFARPLLEIVIQYVSYRFKWEYSQTAYIISFEAAIHITILTLILPIIHAWLTKRYDPERANLFLAKGSILFLVFGTFGVGLSTNIAGLFISIITYTLGCGFLASMRSFLTSLVPRNETALLYTLISIFSSIGALIGSPLLGYTFSAGINLGGYWVGLPFFVGAAVYGLSGLSIWSIRASQAVVRDDLDSSEDSN